MVKEYKYYLVGGNKETKPGCCDVYLTNVDPNEDDEKLNKVFDAAFDQTTPESDLVVKLHFDNPAQIEHFIDTLRYYTE